jgi:glyoxylase-like metal-dependent hydrolase (beta-lactamase superfamily II)
MLIMGGRSNVILLSGGEKNILIDTGTRNWRNRLERRLDILKIEHIDHVILTHAHVDHAGNARRMKEKYGASVIVHRAEGPYLEKGENILPQGTNVFTRIMVNLFAKLFTRVARYEPCPYDHLVDERFDLKDFGFNAFILHTPGHTDGSVSVIVDDEVAVVGDIMIGVFKGSVFPPFANDIPLLIQSWGKLLATGCKVFVPSHGSANSRELVQKDYDRRMKECNPI